MEVSGKDAAPFAAKHRSLHTSQNGHLSRSHVKQRRRSLGRKASAGSASKGEGIHLQLAQARMVGLPSSAAGVQLVRILPFTGKRILPLRAAFAAPTEAAPLTETSPALPVQVPELSAQLRRDTAILEAQNPNVPGEHLDRTAHHSHAAPCHRQLLHVAVHAPLMPLFR